MRDFNTTGLCVPERHYMVDVSERVEQIRTMVERGDYLCMNRARQYGKTTLLAALERALEGDFAVASFDFQGLGAANFRSEGHFTRALCRMLLRSPSVPELPPAAADEVGSIARGDVDDLSLQDLFFALEDWCKESPRPVVLIIDEVDSATNNQVFLDFLAQLRQGYLRRAKKPSYPAFRSVVLAGVTDVRHLKRKIRPDEEAKTNSPWNIAADFKVRMSFDEADVAGMLGEFEADHATGMDVAEVAGEIIAWTGGYPFLCSRVCQLADGGGLGWDRAGVGEAVRLLLRERNTLFDSLADKLGRYPELRETLRRMLMGGERLPYMAMQEDVAQLEMYGFVTRGEDNAVRVANRVFETLLYDLFVADDRVAGSRMYSEGELGRSSYVREGRLDMRAVLEGFRRAYTLAYGPIEGGERFSEFDGRRQFLLFLKPIINGTGNFYIEAQTRDQTRTDVVVDYLGEQFVVELKIWYGRARHEEGEEQLRGYLERFGLDVGYLVSFNFNKGKQPGLRRVEVGDKVLWEETL